MDRRNFYAIFAKGLLPFRLLKEYPAGNGTRTKCSSLVILLKKCEKDLGTNNKSRIVKVFVKSKRVAVAPSLSLCQIGFFHPSLIRLSQDALWYTTIG